MPRETIFTPYPHDPSSGPLPFQMQVGWNPSQDVQVGISTHDDRHLVDYIYADQEDAIGRQVWELLLNRLEYLGAVNRSELATGDGLDPDVAKAIGRGVLDAVTGSTAFGTSVWWSPGREQINRLIRLLRKARDAAYGRDE